MMVKSNSYIRSSVEEVIIRSNSGADTELGLCSKVRAQTEDALRTEGPS